ncbi:hypothetical protein HYALB_00012690 [Hymenoscyphus albidus]|uniref:Uncharacterized protein n=1 Tax=Hymenoscyphus albidus TaxID=595503 RepID=A0A9N9LUX7_9HELO|nr:hypothetical protein HYALB_00012690 [Hymenoscyphus albidus]
MVNSVLFSVSMLLLASKLIMAFNCATHTFGTCADGIVHWYDPDDGLVCDLLDCGGGRAPPKTNVPGCAGYKGTLTTQGPSYLSCFTSKKLVTSTSAFVTTTHSSSVAHPSGVVSHTSSALPNPTTTSGPSSSSSDHNSNEPSSSSIIPSATSVTPTGSTSIDISSTSPSTTSPPTLPIAPQNGTATSASPLTSSSARPNSGDRVSYDSLKLVFGGLVGLMALA